MKRIVCEMCGSTDLIKEDGVFVCQNCGTKYSLEEAKKLMVDVSGSTVKVDASGSIPNFIKLMSGAYASEDFESALAYSNKILEIDSNNSEALKIKAICDLLKSFKNFEGTKSEDVGSLENYYTFLYEYLKRENPDNIKTFFLELLNKAATVVDTQFNKFLDAINNGKTYSGFASSIKYWTQFSKKAIEENPDLKESIENYVISLNDACLLVLETNFKKIKDVYYKNHQSVDSTNYLQFNQLVQQIYNMTNELSGSLLAINTICVDYIKNDAQSKKTLLLFIAMDNFVLSLNIFDKGLFKMKEISYLNENGKTRVRNEINLFSKYIK